MRLPPVLLAAALTTLGLAAQAAAPAGLHLVALIDPGADRSAAQGLVLGAWENGRWLSGKAVAARVPARQAWRVQSLAGVSTTVSSSGPLVTGEAPCEDTAFVPLQAPSPSGRYRLAVSPGLNVRPRPVQVLPSDNRTYQNVVRAELLRRGLTNPVVNVTALVRADLDGNGTQEVIIAASHYRQPGAAPSVPPAHAGKGDYSLLLLRWVQAGQVRTTVLGESLFTRDERSDTDWQMPSLYDLGGVADLNGDGRMELVVTDAYYEGSGAAVLDWSPATGPRTRLNEGCGA